LFEYKQTYNKESDADEDLMLETKEGRNVLVVRQVDRDNNWIKNRRSIWIAQAKVIKIG
jgi:hypothetical protein